MANENGNNLNEGSQERSEGQKREDEIKGETRKEIVNDLDIDKLQLISSSIVRNYISESFDVVSNTFEETSKGVKTGNVFRKISAYRNGMERRSKGEIEISIGLNGKINLHIEPYDHYGEFSYRAENLSDKELGNEIKNIQQIFESGIAFAGSKLVKESYGIEKEEKGIDGNEDFNAADWLDSTFDQKEYDRILAENGLEAAKEYARNNV